MELGGAIQNVLGFLARRITGGPGNEDASRPAPASPTDGQHGQTETPDLPSPAGEVAERDINLPRAVIRSLNQAEISHGAPAADSTGGESEIGPRVDEPSATVAPLSPADEAAASVEHFRACITKAEDGNLSLRELLDEMYDLKGHPPYNSTRRLAAYFCDPEVMAEMIGTLVDEKAVVRVDEQHDARRRMKYQYVIANTIANGPVTDLRMSLVDSDAMVDLLFDYFTTAAAAHRDSAVASEVARVLVVLMDEMPEVMIGHFKRRADAVPALVREISAPHVAELLVRLVGENDNCDLGSNPIFDMVFVDALRVLASAKVFHGLADLFAEAASAHDEPGERETHQMENTTIVTYGLIMRIAKAVPYGRKNKSLWYLNIFENSGPVKTMLESSLEAYRKNHRHPGLVMAINMLVEILATLYFERQNMISANNVTSRIDSDVLEREILRVFPALIEILDDDSRDFGHSPGQLFGRTRLKIIELSVAAFKSCSEETLMALFRMGLHDSLYSLIARHPECSVAHNLVSLAMDICLIHRSVGCKMPWLSELCLPSTVMSLWRTFPKQNYETTAYSSVILTIITTLKKMIQIYEEDENLETLKAIMGNDEYKEFMAFYEENIADITSSQAQKLGGGRPLSGASGLTPVAAISPDHIMSSHVPEEEEPRGGIRNVGNGDGFLSSSTIGENSSSPPRESETRSRDTHRRRKSIDSLFFEEP